MPMLNGNVKALLLAGGMGTRLRPLTDTIPKCLVPIGGRPLLDAWVDRLAEAGIREARINTHAHAGRVREHLRPIGCAHISRTSTPRADWVSSNHMSRSSWARPGLCQRTSIWPIAPARS